MSVSVTKGSLSKTTARAPWVGTCSVCVQRNFRRNSTTKIDKNKIFVKTFAQFVVLLHVPCHLTHVVYFLQEMPLILSILSTLWHSTKCYLWSHWSIRKDVFNHSLIENQSPPTCHQYTPWHWQGRPSSTQSCRFNFNIFSVQRISMQVSTKQSCAADTEKCCKSFTKNKHLITNITIFSRQ